MDKLTEQFEYGDKVEHPVFGVGQVLAFIGDGERLKLLIKFRDYGEKKIAVRHARLKRLSDRPTLAAAAATAAAVGKPELPETLKPVRKTVVAPADVTGGFDDDEHEEDIHDEDSDDEELESLDELEDEDEDEDEEE